MFIKDLNFHSFDGEKKRTLFLYGEAHLFVYIFSFKKR